MAKKSVLPTLEQLAEALILADPEDAQTIRELVDRFRAYSDWACAAHPGSAIAEAAVECVAIACSASAAEPGDTSGFGELGHAFERLQRSTVIAECAQAPAGEEPPQKTRRQTRAARSAKPATPDEPPAGVADDPSLIADFVVRAGELLDSADEGLVSLEKQPGRRDLLDDVFRAFHTLKGMAGFLELDLVQQTAHAAESVLDGPRHGEGDLGPADFSAIFAAVDDMRDQVADVAGASASIAPADGAPGMKGDGQARQVSPEAATEIRPTVRVDEGRLDRLLDAIGEMVIAESMASESTRAEGMLSERLMHQLGRLDKITRELQELATSLRMMPLSSTFRRMGRLVRDLSHKSGKDVELRVSGEETELDKEMVDRISDPLIHLLRNAIDHGIESPEQRRAAGKPSTGVVRLSAYHEGGAVVIQVSDDGRGLDIEAIAQRAGDLGLIEEASSLDERSALALILEPGFSTAREITDVSGRGVGMDVVKRAVEQLRGTVEVSSTRGEGTCFTIRLPLTLAIIDGMVIRVGEERYIIPTSTIQRSVRPLSEHVSTVLNRGSVLSSDDGFVPLVHLGQLFDTPGAEADPSSAIVIICEAGSRRVGLVACEILGQQQTVIKGLGDDLRGLNGLAGGAIMSDGRVGLILDVAGLVAQANAGGGE